jgi:hypothetical protein
MRRIHPVCNSTDNVYNGTDIVYNGTDNVYSSTDNVYNNTNNVYSDTNNVYSSDTQCNNIDIKTEQKEFKCDGCYKSFSRKYNLQQHIPKCTRRQYPNQCTACLKCFTSRGGLSQHKHFCKGYPLIVPNSSSNTVLPSGSTQVNAENVQMIQQQQNAETINNTTNNTVNINILTCPESREEKFDFDCTNISHDDLIAMLQKSKDAFIRFNNFIGKVLDNPKNRVVRKASPKDSHSLVHRGDDKWELAHDDDTFPIITHHMTTAALGKTIELDKNQKNFFIHAFQEQIRVFNEMDYDSLDYNSIVQRIKYHVINITRSVLAEEKRIRKEAAKSSK